MRTRTKRLTAIGSAIGLVLMASAITPAVAAPVATAFPATSCSSFKSATTTGSTVSFSGVLLRAGETITTSVSPATSSDTVSLTATRGLNFIIGGGAASGSTFKVPADGYYNLSYKTTASASVLTWSFNATCGGTTTVSPSPSPSPTATTKPAKGGGKGGGGKGK
jgi:hypothetical protein